MMFKIQCPKCKEDTSLSLIQSGYQGPHRCWKCKELFTIKIENNELKSCEPLTQEDYEKLQAESLKSKFRQL